MLDSSVITWKLSDLSVRLNPNETLGKEKNKNRFYDNFKVAVRRKLIKKLRERREVKDLMHVLRQELVRDIYGIGSPELYNAISNGTKLNIEIYHNEVIKAIEFLYYYEGRQLTFQNKLNYFRDVSGTYGKTAIMFSGGAGFGKYHYGVIKALYE